MVIDAGVILIELAPQVSSIEAVPFNLIVIASVSFVPMGDFVVIFPMLTVVVLFPELTVNSSFPAEIFVVRLPVSTVRVSSV